MCSVELKIWQWKWLWRRIEIANFFCTLQAVLLQADGTTSIQTETFNKTDLIKNLLVDFLK